MTFSANLQGADMEFVKNFTPSDFQARNFTPSISPNFNSFGKKKHKKWRNLHRWQKFYTATGSDAIDKFHLCATTTTTTNTTTATTTTTTGQTHFY